MHTVDRPQRELGFRIHAVVFVAAVVLCAVINYFTGPPYWTLWVILGWGVGLASHWVFGLLLTPKT